MKEKGRCESSMAYQYCLGCGSSVEKTRTHSTARRDLTARVYRGTTRFTRMAVGVTCSSSPEVVLLK